MIKLAVCDTSNNESDRVAYASFGVLCAQTAFISTRAVSHQDALNLNIASTRNLHDLL